MEFIVTNDGSTYKTKDNINNFTSQNRVNNLRIENISNLDLSSVRNLELKLVQGEYVWFLDGDDAGVGGSTSKFEIHRGLPGV